MWVIYVKFLFCSLIIKADTHSGLYYTPDSVLYDNTVPEVWFASEDVAQANGFVKAPE